MVWNMITSGETGQSYMKEEKKMKGEREADHFTSSSHSGVKTERALRQGDGMGGLSY